MAEFVSNSLEDTKKIAFELASKIVSTSLNNKKATVVSLSGELGSGKTTFMKYFAEAIGVEETIQSPTFVIERIYEIPASNFAYNKFTHLVHIDAYRLESGEELSKLGWETLINEPKNLICIEWPERVAEVMPPSIMLRFEHVEADPNSRDPLGANEKREKTEENRRKISAEIGTA